MNMSVHILSVFSVCYIHSFGGYAAHHGSGVDVNMQTYQSTFMVVL